MPGHLYIVATPIGNLDDISARALAILRSVDLLAAEDTRQTQKLLTRYEISKPLTSYHEHNMAKKTGELVAMLASGKSIALVTDAGTPGISDPGQELIRAAAGQNIPITPIPGPSAVITALVASGLPSDRFCFEGFLSASPKLRRRRLRDLAAEKRTLIFYEAPHRVVKTLTDMAAVFGPNRPACLAREMTKVYEEFKRGTLTEILKDVQNASPKGEITIVLQGFIQNPGAGSRGI